MNFGPVILSLHNAVFSTVLKWVLFISDFQNCGQIIKGSVVLQSLQKKKRFYQFDTVLYGICFCQSWEKIQYGDNFKASAYFLFMWQNQCINIYMVSPQDHIILLLIFFLVFKISFSFVCTMVAMQNFIPFFMEYRQELTFMDMLGTENTCSYGTVSMCQNNKTLHTFKPVFHSDLLGKCKTSSVTFAPVCHSERFLFKLHPKKPPFIYSILVLMLSCKFLPLSGIQLQKGEGGKHRCKNRSRRKVVRQELNVEMLCWMGGGWLSQSGTLAGLLLYLLFAEASNLS